MIAVSVAVLWKNTSREGGTVELPLALDGESSTTQSRNPNHNLARRRVAASYHLYMFSELAVS
jgi:hypothetical protein